MIAGFIIYRFAPEAEGHGTDAVISAFHQARGVIQGRVPIIKVIASAITIGSGGSAGKEGPIAQIAAGAGSVLASHFKLSDRDRRIMMVTGMSAGIASIFKSPLGGALFGIEVLYKRDFEMGAVVPAIMASVIGYALFVHFTGPDPIFLTCQCAFDDPLELPFYALLGLTCAAIGIFYISLFYSTRDKFFRRLRIPNHLKPAIGGLGVGVLILLFPDASSGILGPGYDALQDALLGNITLSVMIVLIFAKILATSFTVGSGGSGGVFAPSLVIGGMVGGVVGEVSHIFFPNIITNPTCFVLVGMASFFSAVAKVPIASILMISEMTGSYALLVPLMLANVASYAFTERWTIYESQVSTRLRSPAHRKELLVDVLEGIKVKDAMNPHPLSVSPDDKLRKVFDLMEKTGHMGYPVMKDGKLIGMVTMKDLEKVPMEEWDRRPVKDVTTTGLVTTYPDESLEDALHKLVLLDIGRLPVVDRRDPKKLLGIITRSDIARAHVKAMAGDVLASRRKHAVSSSPIYGTRIFEVYIPPHHWMIGKKLADIRLPAGIIIAILREEGIIIPRGDTMIEAGDRLVIFSPEDRVDGIRRYIGL
ncbi:MAG TPA: CBS domain-containing protein [Candidatus Syntrophoarchaeum butanivorans]|uniref:CBS domain-containing protein n=1 Tax=Candidatus Syntropharchaeum butanivorans TaxID=1839936 RepID=A0A1F2P569_9EURY|nr:MAG: chloride channel protein [Candidatus Syntrophoarchaeum butanivorans]HEC56664.1 CBS domain-containing protein [Candidatus Syntrophoarchaeum butanivorans]